MTLCHSPGFAGWLLLNQNHNLRWFSQVILPISLVETGFPTDTAADHLWASAAKVLEPGDVTIKTWGFANKKWRFDGFNPGRIATRPWEIQISSRRFVVFGKGKVGFAHGFKNKQKTTHGGFLKIGAPPNRPVIRIIRPWWNWLEQPWRRLQNTSDLASLNFFCCQYPWRPGQGLSQPLMINLVWFTIVLLSLISNNNGYNAL